jgi:nicotine oxidoreductase
MLAPVENLVYRLYKRGICDSQGNPMQKASWAVMDDVQIVEKYNSILWGILNYYSFVNHYHNLSRIQYILQYSAAKTLANKHKSSLRKVFKKCGRSLTVCFMKNGEALKKSLRLETSWCTRPNRFHTNGKTYNGPDGIVKTHWRLRTRSKLEEPCAVCGSDTTVEMHHVRHIRKIGYKTTGFSRIMAGLNRKQIPVCSECHEGIHAGRYDGHNLKYLIPSSLPAS